MKETRENVGRTGIKKVREKGNKNREIRKQIRKEIKRKHEIEKVIKVEENEGKKVRSKN